MLRIKPRDMVCFFLNQDKNVALLALFIASLSPLKDWATLFGAILK